jgi:hypothetical protein
VVAVATSLVDTQSVPLQLQQASLLDLRAHGEVGPLIFDAAAIPRPAMALEEGRILLTQGRSPVAPDSPDRPFALSRERAGELVDA